ncbi:hypothetical protein PF005_g1204 [Phytophthora fragariae]|nr:hypothetical protein PF005_g1204 [Phytophthora fragariae]
MSSALSASDGDEVAALTLLTAKFKGGTKREHSAVINTMEKRRRIEANDGQVSEQEVSSEEDAPVDLEEDEVDDDNGEQEGEHGDNEDISPQKLSRLAEDVRKKPAVVTSNQAIVDAFMDYGDEQLHGGHTGKGVTHLRAALAIRDYPHAITSVEEARAVPMVGVKMAEQVKQILSTGELKVKTPRLNISAQDVEDHTPPRLVREVRHAQAKCPENQALVDELAQFGEHELYFRSRSKGNIHLRAARALQLTDLVIKSGDQARHNVPFVGSAIADKIDQILKYGRIFKDTPVSSGIRKAPIVKDLRENPAVRHENQHIVDALVDYGDSHLHSGHRGKGIAHLRAARAIRDADVVVKREREPLDLHSLTQRQPCQGH